MKARRWEDRAGRKGISFYCQGCQMTHTVTTEGPEAWGWNGDLERPVLSPSVLATITYPDHTYVCHTFVGCNGAQPGEILFLGDCTHEHAGKVLPLADWPDHVEAP